MEHAHGEPVRRIADEPDGEVGALGGGTEGAAVDRADLLAVTDDRHALDLALGEHVHGLGHHEPRGPTARRVVVAARDEDADAGFGQSLARPPEGELGTRALLGGVVDVAGAHEEVHVTRQAELHDRVERPVGGCHELGAHARVRGVDPLERRVEMQVCGVHEAHRFHGVTPPLQMVPAVWPIVAGASDTDASACT